MKNTLGFIVITLLLNSCAIYEGFKEAGEASGLGGRKANE